MDWFIVALVVLGIFGLIGKGIEAKQRKKRKAAIEEELTIRRRRAKEVRVQILASGNKEMIA